MPNRVERRAGALALEPGKQCVQRGLVVGQITVLVEQRRAVLVGDLQQPLGVANALRVGCKQQRLGHTQRVHASLQAGRAGINRQDTTGKRVSHSGRASRLRGCAIAACQTYTSLGTAAIWRELSVAPLSRSTVLSWQSARRSTSRGLQSLPTPHDGAA